MSALPLPDRILGAGFAAAANHVLAQASWARARLAPWAQHVVRFRAPPFDLSLRIRPAGDTEPAPPGSTATTTVSLTPALIARGIAGDAAAWREAAVEGDAALAREVAFLAQHLRWDAEEDLARVFGDIAAHRIADAARGAARLGAEALQSWERSLAAYWTEERPLIAQRQDIAAFNADVDRLREAVDRLEARLARLAHSQGGS